MLQDLGLFCPLLSGNTDPTPSPVATGEGALQGKPSSGRPDRHSLPSSQRGKGRGWGHLPEKLLQINELSIIHNPKSASNLPYGHSVALRA